MRATPTVAALLLAGCAGPAQAPHETAVPWDCKETVFPDDRFVSEAFTDKYEGLYWSAAARLRVWREGQRLYVEPPDGPRRQLRRLGDVPGEGRFQDGCGVTYDFLLPPDGPGGYVVVTQSNGARSEWPRR